MQDTGDTLSSNLEYFFLALFLLPGKNNIQDKGKPSL